MSLMFFRADSIESGRPRLMSLATMLDCDLTRPVDVMNGIACIKNIEFTVENIEFQRELPNRRVIEILHDKKVMRIFRRVRRRSPFDSF